MGTKKYKICVVGAGHVGLVAAACFAKLGHDVLCADNDKERIEHINNKKMPFYEPQMEELVISGLKKGNLTFISSLKKAVLGSEVIFIAVGTPPNPDGSADLTSVENVARTVAENLNGYKLIIGKSTVPVHTGEHIKATINRYKKNSKGFDVASNPEFLREGKAVYDFFHPDRIVLGVESKKAEMILKDIYHRIKTPIIVTDVNTAELIKHASNSFLSMKISYINALSRICDLVGADVEKIAEAMGLDRRIGRDFLNAGIGYGGFCFPKDVEAFSYISRKVGYKFTLLNEVKAINDKQPLYFVDKIKKELWVLKGKKIGVLGLSFKPGTDDIRFSPALAVIRELSGQGAKIYAYDPQAMPAAREELSGCGVVFCKNIEETAKGADCLCVLTEWQEFISFDYTVIKSKMNYVFIADGRNCLDRSDLEAAGFKYIGMGVSERKQTINLRI